VTSRSQGLGSAAAGASSAASWLETSSLDVGSLVVKGFAFNDFCKLMISENESDAPDPLSADWLRTAAQPPDGDKFSV